MVTHPGTDRARRALTLFMRRTPAANHYATPPTRGAEGPRHARSTERSAGASTDVGGGEQPEVPGPPRRRAPCAGEPTPNTLSVTTAAVNEVIFSIMGVSHFRSLHPLKYLCSGYS